VGLQANCLEERRISAEKRPGEVPGLWQPPVGGPLSEQSVTAVKLLVGEQVIDADDIAVAGFQLQEILLLPLIDLEKLNRDIGLLLVCFGL